MTEAPAKSFTSWKLDVWNAISMDAELNPTERIIAWRLLNRASGSGEIYPSQETLAIETAVSEQTVKLSIAVLVKRGWIARERQNRRDSNRYSFNEHLVEMIRAEVQDCLEERIPRVRKRTFKKQLEGQNSTPLEGTISDQLRVQQLTPNTYKEHPVAEHPLTAGVEEEVLSPGASVGTECEPAGAVAPHNASKPAGGSHPPAPSSSLLNSKALREARNGHVTVDPFTSLDRLEADIKAGRYRQ